ncbi:MAG: deoxyribodipyrimidine photo-lyase [candidate division WOR-3 bacterium]|nr:MAG: deoxyribodipyrimidine photo-lyase [candidate division WOR-3 bacterium]
MTQQSRIQRLNDRPVLKRDYVLYWMQQSQREEYNHALEYAVDRANDLSRPVLVFFGITDRFPDADLRHYRFMLEGLAETRDRLERRGIGMVVRVVSPEQGALQMARDACLVVCDRGYLRLQKEWRKRSARGCDVLVEQVETDVVVPVETASDHEEYAAATFRPRVMECLAEYLVPLRRRTVKVRSSNVTGEAVDVSDVDAVLGRLHLQGRVRGVGIRGGTSQAKKRLARFIRSGLGCFVQGRNDPNQDCCSGLSPYLHFGQVSPLFVALAVMKAGGPGRDAFIEELVVRRELAMNFVHYNDSYDSYDCLPDWAKKTLAKHVVDRREYMYTRRELDRGQTHDRYWNAAQLEMKAAGRMHGYMRMYWGKKILEWSRSPEEAFETAMRFNNKYELDGRDPNGFAGVAWCLGKHDRPWQERPIFGMVRYMNAAGLRRKFDADRYAESVLESRIADGNS